MLAVKFDPFHSILTVGSYQNKLSDFLENHLIFMQKVISYKTT